MRLSEKSRELKKELKAKFKGVKIFCKIWKWVNKC